MEARSKGQLLILDFDIEARPLAWLSSDFCTKEPTAIAWAYTDGGPVFCRTLAEHGMKQMLGDFEDYYYSADIVTGHFIRGYDLPTLHAAILEFGFKPLPAKLASDTKLDLLKYQGISESQKNLAALLGIEAGKVDMTEPDWRSANRLEPAGTEKLRERVMGDVAQHRLLRAALLERGALGPPKLWTPESSGKGGYRP